MTEEQKPVTQELKACPFCDGAAEIDTMRGYSHFPPDRVLFKTSSEVAIYCLSCGAEMSFDPDENGESREHVESWLTEAWNTRIESGVVAELARALRAYLSLTESPAPRADDRKMQWLSAALNARNALAKLEASK